MELSCEMITFASWHIITTTPEKKPTTSRIVLLQLVESRSIRWAQNTSDTSTTARIVLFYGIEIDLLSTKRTQHTHSSSHRTLPPLGIEIDSLSSNTKRPASLSSKPSDRRRCTHRALRTLESKRLCWAAQQKIGKHETARIILFHLVESSSIRWAPKKKTPKMESG